ncbi:MAG: radical SAM protein [Candidatus Brocadiaceae bacterium]|nr:radical SAM protein [Candidatus Brocadiaceae bacterium]
MKKIVLTHPNQRWLKEDIVTTWDLPPTTLCLLGAMVKDIVDVKVIDAQKYNLTKEQFGAEIEKYKPDFVGISQLTSEYAEVLDMAAEIVKAVDSNIVVIAGGVHVTTSCHEVLSNSHIDYACRGEGEYVLRELLLYLQDKGSLPKKGLLYREKGKEIVQERALIEDLTKLPWADYSLVNLGDFLESYGRAGPTRFPGSRGLPIVVTRGCPFQCTFCQVETISGHKVRARDPIDIVDELEYLKEHYALNSFVFEDDNIFFLKKMVKPLLREMISRNLGLKWVAASFALFVMDDELLDLMKEAGCVGVNVAVESGNERVLKEIINKPIKNLKQVPGKIDQIRETGMFVLANFIIGSPGETWEEIRETCRFAEDCNADYVKIFAAVPLKGTVMYENAVRMNLLEIPKDAPQADDWRYSRIKSDEWTSKDISILRAYEWDRINFSPDRMERIAEIWGVSIEEMNRIRKETRDSLHF